MRDDSSFFRHRVFSSKRGGIFKIVFILFILIALASAIGIIKIKFMVGEQLRLTIMPEYYETSAISPGNVTFDTNVKLYNKFMCEASCNYTLMDMSDNVLLDSGTFYSEAFKVEHYSRTIPLTYNGYGTSLYLYTVQCVNNYTTVCPANQDMLIRKSLMAVSYRPSEAQLSASRYLKEAYPAALQNFVSASKNILVSGKILEALPLALDKSMYFTLEAQRSSVDDNIGRLITIWRTDDYLQAKSYWDDNGVAEKSQSMLSNSVSYKDSLYKAVDDHNFLLDEFSGSYPLLMEYREFLSLNEGLSYMDSSEQAQILHFIMKSNSIIDAFNYERYNFTQVSYNAMDLRSAIKDVDNMILENANKGLIENYMPLYVYSNIFCMLDENSVLCQNDFSMYPQNVSEALEKFENVCTIASDINDESRASDKLSNKLSNGTDSVMALALQYKLLLDYEFMLSQSAVAHDSDNPEFLPSASIALSTYKDYISNTLADEYGIIDIEEIIGGLDDMGNDTSNITLGENNLLLDDVYDISRYCSSESDVKIPELLEITAKHYAIPAFEEPEIMTTQVPESVPQCCIYDRCQSCEKHNDNNPLIMLHGHSFNKEIDAYRAIESFDGFEYAFMADNLYFLTGMLVQGTNSTAGILGRYVVPAAVKPTYYLETYNELFGLTVSESKDENIDTYALRLKESIDYVLYVTGNDKVDIVAHSMGGLVTRRYIQIFGMDKVDTVILIGTPNNGINDKTYGLCKIFGADEECEDMRGSGLFIKKLNDPSNQPDMSKMYLVIGKGCDTEGADGDGVVTADSVMIEGVPMQNILYTEGDCEEIGGFHRQLLNVDKYPEVYAFVKEKLEENADR
ncbi:MAG: alpha/beta fold hydrolase [Candidatus Woesearchaeota archaeon]